jgi:arylsulfatase A-like enzyme
MPTLLALLGVPAPPSDGASMLPAIRGRGAEEPAKARFSELGSRPDLRSAVLGSLHLIAGVDGAMLFDWRADPGEQRDLGAGGPGRGADLERALASWLDHLAASPLRSRAELQFDLSEEQKKRLRALGYAP